MKNPQFTHHSLAHNGVPLFCKSNIVHKIFPKHIF